MTDFSSMGERILAIRGGNCRISEYAAAVEALSTRMARWRGVAGAYRRRLLIKKSRLWSGDGETWMTTTLNATVPAAEAHSTTKRLDAGCVEWRRWWWLLRYRHPAFADVRRAVSSVTDTAAARVIGLLFHDELNEAEIDWAVACLR